MSKGIAHSHALPPSLAPIGLCREEAAAYISVSPNTFDKMRLDGRMPAPRVIGTRRVWHRQELDLAFANLPRDGDDDPNPWDAATG